MRILIFNAACHSRPGQANRYLNEGVLSTTSQNRAECVSWHHSSPALGALSPLAFSLDRQRSPVDWARVPRFRRTSASRGLVMVFSGAPLFRGPHFSRGVSCSPSFEPPCEESSRAKYLITIGIYLRLFISMDRIKKVGATGSRKQADVRAFGSAFVLTKR